ncbi:MAG: hypothetical protein ACKVX7_01135 [Planctomycetota bacterium]
MIRMFAISSIVCVALGIGWVSAQDTPAPPLELHWSKPEGQQLFADGQQLFGAGNYEEAAKKFQDAVKFAKDSGTKGTVRSWQKGAAGGVRLTLLRKSLAGGEEKKALLDRAAKEFEEIRATPIEEKFMEFVLELERELYLVIESFEVESGRYGEKSGKSFCSDPGLARRGKRCIKWEPTGNEPELKVKELPKDLEQYRALSYWMYFERGSASYAVVFKAPGKSKGGTGAAGDNVLVSQRKPHEGWQRIEIPFKEFLKFGEVKWSEVEDLRIKFTGSRPMTIYVDDIALVKK